MLGSRGDLEYKAEVQAAQISLLKRQLKAAQDELAEVKTALKPKAKSKPKPKKTTKK